MSRFVILGSANAVAKEGQDNTHLLIEGARKVILVDCGDNPMAKLSMAGSSIHAVTDLVLTHFHADHVGSLPLLLMDMWLEKRTTPLTIHGLEVTLEKAKKLLDLFGWLDWKEMFPVNFAPTPQEGEPLILSDNEVKVFALPVVHLVPTIGLRVELGSHRVVAYSCDTEPCQNVLRLASGAAVLLQEAAGAAKGHTSPEQAGIIARDAGVKKLILIHYDNRVNEEVLLAEARKHFQGEISLAQDLFEV
ncbi:MAG: MBL fold metallo-hydrolase [Anaerolineaceae bacterium]|nr:MBL fold metallo-hydrolase [Anaerolineaceae bacterium]